MAGLEGHRSRRGGRTRGSPKKISELGYIEIYLARSPGLVEIGSLDLHFEIQDPQWLSNKLGSTATGGVAAS
jgi:hypothetical protein